MQLKIKDQNKTPNPKTQVLEITNQLLIPKY